jgi:hypothetical protein
VLPSVSLWRSARRSGDTKTENRSAPWNFHKLPSIRLPPAPTSPSRSLCVVYGVVLGILVIQLVGWSAACGPSAAGEQTHCDGRRELYESGSAWACPPGELDLGPHRASRPATDHPRAAVGRPDGTARPRLSAGWQRHPRLRLGPGQGDLGNPDPAHAASRCVSPLERSPPSQLNRTAPVPTEP